MKNEWLARIEAKEEKQYADGVVNGKLAMIGTVLTSHGHELHRDNNLPACLLDKAFASGYVLNEDGELVLGPSRSAYTIKGNLQEAPKSSKYMGILHALSSNTPNDNGDLFTCNMGSPGFSTSMSSLDLSHSPKLDVTITSAVFGNVSERGQSPTGDEKSPLLPAPTGSFSQKSVDIMKDALVTYKLGRGMAKAHEAADIEYFKKSMFSAMMMPSDMTANLASENMRTVSKTEAEQQLRSANEWKEPSQDGIVSVSNTGSFTLSSGSLSCNTVVSGPQAMMLNSTVPSNVTISGNQSLQYIPSPVQAESRNNGSVFYVDIGAKTAEETEVFAAKLKNLFKEKAKALIKVPVVTVDLIADLVEDTYREASARDPWNQPGVGNWKN